MIRDGFRIAVETVQTDPNANPRAVLDTLRPEIDDGMSTCGYHVPASRLARQAALGGSAKSRPFRSIPVKRTMRNIAHRGASGYAPENTRAAFALAIEMGADMIETDVQLTRDGALVLIHDTTVTRTTDASGPVGDYSLEELQALDIGGWYGAEFGGERVLTLAEAIAGFLPRIPFVFEIKDPRATPALGDRLAEGGIRERVHVTSFFWPALLDARDLDPSLTLGFLSRAFDADIIRRCVARGFAQICPPVESLTADLVTEAHDAGLVVRAHGISERTQIDRLVDTGVDGATVNWPDWLAALAK